MVARSGVSAQRAQQSTRRTRATRNPSPTPTQTRVSVSSQPPAGGASAESESTSGESSLYDVPDLESDDASLPESAGQADIESDPQLSNPGPGVVNPPFPGSMKARNSHALTEVHLALKNIVPLPKDGIKDLRAVSSWLADSDSAWTCQHLRHVGKYSVPEGVTTDPEALDQWLKDF